MRTITAVALGGAMALTLAACGGDADGGVATLGEGGDAAEASVSPSMSEEEALQAFAECMRANGVEDFQDPQIGEDGRITFGVGPGGGEGAPPSEEDRSVMEDAMKACEDLLPRGTGEGPGQLSSEDEAALQDAMLEYARCMREQGIDMPDPTFDDGGGALVRMPEGSGPDDEGFQAADEVCRPILDEVMPDGPRP